MSWPLARRRVVAAGPVAYRVNGDGCLHCWWVERLDGAGIWQEVNAGHGHGTRLEAVREARALAHWRKGEYRGVAVL